MAIVLIRQDGKEGSWAREFAVQAPELPVFTFGAPHDIEKVRMAVVWKHPEGALTQYPNLELIASFGAGVDFIFQDPATPEGVPVTRVVDPELSADMAEFVLARILEYARGFRRMREDVQKSIWNPEPYKRLREFQVGIMGYGELGSSLGNLLQNLGCKVSAWTRSPKPDAPLPVYAGEAGLPHFLKTCEILVCLLPLTEKTQGILNTALFSALPRGAFLINAARGGHLVEKDFLRALDSGQLSGAALDVFQEEPLPPGHPFWSHKAIAISPHVASVSDIAAVVPQLVRNYHNLLQGNPLQNVVSRDLGY